MLSTASVADREMSAIPPPSYSGAAVFAWVTLRTSALRTVETLLFKPLQELHIFLDGTSFQLVAGTARTAPAPHPRWRRLCISTIGG